MAAQDRYHGTRSRAAARFAAMVEPCADYAPPSELADMTNAELLAVANNAPRIYANRPRRVAEILRSWQPVRRRP